METNIVVVERGTLQAWRVKHQVKILADGNIYWTYYNTKDLVELLCSA